MSKFKITIWLIVLGLLGTLFYQNSELFLSKKMLSIDLGFIKSQTPELPVVLYFLATLIIGLLISYIFGLSDRFKSKKTIKTLTATLDGQREEVILLRKEVDALKNSAADAVPTATPIAEPVSATITESAATPSAELPENEDPISLDADFDEMRNQDSEKIASDEEENRG